MTGPMTGPMVFALTRVAAVVLLVSGLLLASEVWPFWIAGLDVGAIKIRTLVRAIIAGAIALAAFGVATSLWSAKIDRQNDRGPSR